MVYEIYLAADAYKKPLDCLVLALPLYSPVSIEIYG
jgi:hypothetical protein